MAIRIENSTSYGPKGAQAIKGVAKVISDARRVLNALKHKEPMPKGLKLWVHFPDGDHTSDPAGISLRYGVRPVYFFEGQDAPYLSVRGRKDAIEKYETIILPGLEAGKVDAEIASKQTKRGRRRK